jgi:hypothetical protein
MKCYLLLTLFFLSSAFAQSADKQIAADQVIYHFSTLDKRIAPDQFRRYVIPQLKSAINEYYLLIKNIEPTSADIIDIKKSYTQLTNQWEEWKSNCLVGADECDKKLQKIYKNYKGVEKNFNAFRGVLHQQDIRNTASVDTILSIHQELNELVVLDTRLLRALEEMLLTMNTPYWVPAPLAREIEQSLHRANLISGLIFTRLLPKNIADDFEFIWHSFISPIEKYVVRNNSDEFLMRKLETFNNNWNAFHMKIAKSNKDVDRSTIQIVSTMHTRWNNVLKVIMKRW